MWVWWSALSSADKGGLGCDRKQHPAGGPRLWDRCDHVGGSHCSNQSLPGVCWGARGMEVRMGRICSCPKLPQPLSCCSQTMELGCPLSMNCPTSGHFKKEPLDSQGCGELCWCLPSQSYLRDKTAEKHRVCLSWSAGEAEVAPLWPDEGWSLIFPQTGLELEPSLGQSLIASGA